MIINVLKGGTRVSDLTGHFVRREDCPDAYMITEQINREGGKHTHVHQYPAAEDKRRVAD